MRASVLIFFVSLSAFAQQAPTAASFARKLCGEPPGRVGSLLRDFQSHPPQGIDPIDLDRLKAVISAYHPASRDAYEAVGVVSNVRILPSAKELGSESDWRGVKLQTAELRSHAFGISKCRVPVARFDRGSAHLSYVATEHVRRDPQAREEVFRVIKKEFEASRPGAVVVEGYPERFPCSEAVRIFLTPVDQLASEPEYLSKLALGQGATVFGGEPDDVGLPSPDQERFSLLRQITTVHGVDAQEAYREVQKQIPLGDQVSYSDFLSWYRRVNGREFRVENAWTDITPSFNIPRGELVRATNKMSDRVDLNRDSHVVQMIRRALLNRGRVLVAYGADHFPRQMPVFESVFGPCATPVAKCVTSQAKPGFDERCSAQ